MGNFQENAALYDSSSLLKQSSVLRGRQLLLFHGLKDRKLVVLEVLRFLKYEF